jgi:hypothetical protein
VTKAIKAGKATAEVFNWAKGVTLGKQTASTVSKVNAITGTRVWVENWPPGFGGSGLPGKPGSTPVPLSGATAAERAAARRAAADEAATAASRFRGGPGLAGWSPYTLPLLTAGDSAKGQGTEHMTKKQVQAHYSQVAGIKSLYKSVGADKFGYKGSTDADTLLSRVLGKDPQRGVALLQNAATLAGKTYTQFAKTALPKSARKLEDLKQENEQQATLNKLLGVTTTSRQRATLSLDQYAAGLRELPPGVATKITAPGFQATSANVKKLQHQYGLTKPELRTIVRLLGGPAAISAADRVQARLSALNGKTATTYIHTITSSSGVGSKKPAQNLGGLLGKPHRAGGPIVGPGGPRDDNILTPTSNGEFVVNAEAYRRNRALVEAINANRYANGGPIGNARAVAPVASSTNVSIDGPVRLVLEDGRELNAWFEESYDAQEALG